MRKGIAIICLTVFIALQYGKLVSYWHCRYIVVNKAACDCEKLLTDHNKDGSPHATAAIPAKDKAEENYCCDETIAQQTPLNTSIIHIPVYTSLIPDDHSSGIFQPPRL
jgi:hypothetical protein